MVKDLNYRDIGSAGITAGPDNSLYVVHYSRTDGINTQCVSKIVDGVVTELDLVKVQG